MFVQQLHRAAAQRGRLDPVYQDLSDHWTAILQRLYPVWALIGPGLSDPGHIEIHSRTVYLDSETLLGSRAEIAAGALERRAILRCFGVATPRDDARQAHQALGDRARHRARPSPTTRPTGSSPSTGGCSRSRGWRPTACASSHPTRCAAGSSAARCRPRSIDVILPAFAEQVLDVAAAGQPLTRDLAARATVYLQARTHYGIVDPRRL